MVMDGASMVMDGASLVMDEASLVMDEAALVMDMTGFHNFCPLQKPGSGQPTPLSPYKNRPSQT